MMAVNTASGRVMEKAGMQLVATVFPVFQDPIPGSGAGEVICEIREILNPSLPVAICR